MKGLFARLSATPRLSVNREIALSALPAALWTVGIWLRPWLIVTRCVTPNTCTPESVNRVDRMAMTLQWGLADGLSFDLQNISIFCGMLLPFVYQGLSARKWKLAWEDTILWAQIALWNGLFMEVTRLLVQRPRPFVYANPLVLGTEAAHYVSFYSGHTSFVAATWTGLVITAWSRKASSAWLFGALGAWQLMPFLTGYFRVLAGRHFLSDVVVGMIAGTCVAIGVHAAHRKN